MQVSVTFRGMDSTEALKAYSEEKLEHVMKVAHKPMEAHVILSVEKFRHLAEVTLIANGETLVADEQTEDMYKSIDKVMDKLTRQARKSKEKIKGRRRRGVNIPTSSKSDDEVYDDDDDGSWDDSQVS